MIAGGKYEETPTMTEIFLTEDSPYLVEIRDPDGVLTENAAWISNRRRGDEEAPVIIIRVKGSTLKFTLKGRGYVLIKVEGSSDMITWQELYTESGEVSESAEGWTCFYEFEEFVCYKTVELPIEQKEFIRFTLMDGAGEENWIGLVKVVTVKNKQPLPLCNWLSSHPQITSMDIAALVLAANGIKDLGFVVLRKDVEGVAEIYKGGEYDCGW